MELYALKDTEFQHQHRVGLRPFYYRLLPAYDWENTVSAIVAAIQDELARAEKGELLHDAFFVYPTDQQLKDLWEDLRKFGVFMSEIRGEIGINCAEALTILAGVIRLEKEGPRRAFLQERFAAAWEAFSEYTYARGLETDYIRTILLRTLLTTNVFALVNDKRWEQNIAYYFTTEGPRNNYPIQFHYSDIPKMLEASYKGTRLAEYNLSTFYEQDLPRFCRELEWNIDDAEMQVCLSRLERDRSELPCHFYQLPLHLIRLEIDDDHRDIRWYKTPFQRLLLSYLLILSDRHTLMDRLVPGQTYRLDELVAISQLDRYTVKMVVGHLIQIGLMEFNRQYDWHSQHQHYTLIRAI